MYIRRIYPGGGVNTCTPRQYFDTLVEANIGFVYNEDNDEYYWQPEGVEEPPFVMHPLDKQYWETVNISNVGNGIVYMWPTSISESDRTAGNSTKLWNPDNNNTVLAFDYITFGKSILYRPCGTNSSPNRLNSFIAAPVVDDDDWYVSDGAYIYNRRNKTKTNILNQAGNDGYGQATATSVRLGKLWDGTRSRFADNVFIATVRPIMWENGYLQVEVGGKVFMLMDWSNNSTSRCIAFDITDYINEED